jgi:hypothetical protein
MSARWYTHMHGHRKCNVFILFQGYIQIFTFMYESQYGTGLVSKCSGASCIICFSGLLYFFARVKQVTVELLYIERL